MGCYMCNCYNRDSVCNSKVESMGVSRTGSILPPLGHLVGHPLSFSRKIEKSWDCLFSRWKSAESLSMCHCPCFHKPVLLSFSTRFSSKWGTTVCISLYYITMSVINQAKKQKKIEHFPYTTWNPSWSCSIPTSENISSMKSSSLSA